MIISPFVAPHFVISCVRTRVFPNHRMRTVQTMSNVHKVVMLDDATLPNDEHLTAHNKAAEDSAHPICVGQSGSSNLVKRMASLIIEEQGKNEAAAKRVLQ